jgi:hypothetical protein
MATPTIIVNSSTGSDVAASGAGPAVALTGSAASTSGTGLVITLDGSPDLTNVLTDGSHVHWMNTPSGRQFSPITAKDNTAKTITVSAAYTASLTGQTWAIGGKRASLDNVNTRKLFSADAAAGWAVDLQEAGSVYSLTSTLSIALSGLAVTSSTTNRPTITTSVNSTRLVTYTGAVNGMCWNHVKFTNTATTRSSCLFPLGGVCSGHMVSDCVFDGFDKSIDGSNGVGYVFYNLVIDSCEFKNCVSGTSVIYNAANGGAVSLTTATDCFFHDNPGTVFLSYSAVVAERCVFTRNTRPFNGSGSLILRNCDIHGSTDTTIGNAAVTAFGTNQAIELTGNIFYGNAATAVSITATPTFIQRSNAYGGNAANRSGFSAGAGDITLTADPYTNAAGNDFTHNATAGGGALLKGVLNNVRAPGLVGTAYGDIGAFQSQAAASGGTVNFAY